MELWSEIRRKVLVEGVSKRAICREYGVGWWTLEKMLAHPEPPGYRHRVLRGRPRLGAFVGVIDEILAGDADPSTPRKQRHTARRIFERLRDEHGYLGGEVAVRRYVASQRRVSGEVFVPLSQPAGEAQFDFGEATVEIAGVRAKAALAVMTLPYSDAFLVSAYPRECTETFQAGHVAAFAFFGGVPTKTAYDNTRIAVSRIVGGNERTLDGQVSQRQGVRGAAPVALHGVRPGERRSLL
jgi:transposase